MKIGFDASDINPDKAGIGYYSSELLKALLKAGKDNNYVLYSYDRTKLAEFENFSKAEIIDFKSSRPNWKWIVKVARHSKSNVDWLISPSYFMMGVINPKTIQVIHDIAPITFPQFWPKMASVKFKIQLWLSTFRTKKFVTISENTRREFIHRFHRVKGRTSVIGIGINEWTKKEVTKDELSTVKTKYDLPDNYILSISTIQPRKNYKNMISGFAEYAKENDAMHYVIGGKKGWYYEEIFELVKKLKMEDKIHFIGYVDEKDMPALYDMASALIFMSFEEGAGLPSLEAYARKLPVSVSDIAVHREVMQDKAFYANPHDVSDIAAKIKLAVDKGKAEPDPDFLDDYTWENVAQRLLQAIKDNNQ